MHKKRIKKVAVLGSGIMGSGIACHFANIGVEVVLLDIVPQALNDKEVAAGLSLEDKAVRNRIVNESLQQNIKSKPAPLYHSSFVNRIETGNFEDDLHKIKDVDWIIEVVIERLDIKKQVFEKVEIHRTPGTLITTNTSGIPIHLMSEGRSEDFQKHFCGTHFFNPPRYLELFEVIPGPNTSPEVLEFLIKYADKFLGKTPVKAKDTPAFIGNRIGIYGIQSLFALVKEMGLTIEEVDKLTGPVIGRPKSATFRTIDVVGLDTLVRVADGIYENVPDDEEHMLFQTPQYVQAMLDNNWLGSKTNNKGFYQRIKQKDGPSKILALDLETLEYREQRKVSFPTLELTKPISNLTDRFSVLIKGKDKAGEFYRKNFGGMFAYCTHRIPEITDSFYSIDDAMKAGFGWDIGPFEIWDAIGFEKGLELIKNLGKTPAVWVNDMQESGHKSFYKTKDSKRYFYDISTQDYKLIPGQDAFIILESINKEKVVFENSGIRVTDLGDGIINAEFISKMNAIGGDVLSGLNKAIDIAEKDFDGLVIGNQGKNFSVGANIGMIFMMAVEQEYEELNRAVKYFQDTTMRLRYSSVPTIVAPHGMTLGGGCEMVLHADKVVAAAESYIGLVEMGVGVIPGGGGSKEMALRAGDLYQKGNVELNTLQEYFLSIGMAKVSTSAYEAFDTGILKSGKDIVVVNKKRQLAIAKQVARLMADQGYTQPSPRNDIRVLGKQALGMFLVGTHSMEAGHFISEHDRKIANKLAYVMAGGDLSEPSLVSEQYLLDLEREAFLSLATERKTLERLQHMIQKNKPLRN